MGESNGQAGVVDYYTDVVLPALAERLDAAFPEFGWRRDTRGWVATNEETTHRVLGVRAERVVAHGPAPRGFLVHGADPVLWTAYLNGGQIPRGADFVRTVETLAERAGVDTAPLERPQPKDQKAEVLEFFFGLAQREFGSESGAPARKYLESRGLPGQSSLEWGLGVVPSNTAEELARAGFAAQEIESSGLIADRRWPGRICGAWRSERGRIHTLWARPAGRHGDPDSKYLYLRGARRAGLPPYGLCELLSRPLPVRKEVIVVEGLLDVHHLRARGIGNVVALGGTTIEATTFERLAQLGIERLTLCLDRDGPGRAAAARAIERAVSATRSPQLLILDPRHLAPAKDPDEFVRQRGEDAWNDALSERECGIVWRAEDLTKTTSPDAPAWERRGALARAGAWLGTLPRRLALEQEDAVWAIAERCGYSPPAVERAFQARYWNAHERELGRSGARGIER